LLTVPAWSQQKRVLTADDFAAIHRVSDPNLSPDGTLIAYVVKTVSLKQDKTFTDVYMIPATGGDEIQLTSDELDNAHPNGSPKPRWSPDNKSLAYLAKRDKKPQLFLLRRTGGIATQLTDVKEYISDFAWSPDSKKIVLVMADLDPSDTDDEKDKDKKKTTP